MPQTQQFSSCNVEHVMILRDFLTSDKNTRCHDDVFGNVIIKYITYQHNKGIVDTSWNV